MHEAHERNRPRAGRRRRKAAVPRRTRGRSVDDGRAEAGGGEDGAADRVQSHDAQKKVQRTPSRKSTCFVVVGPLGGKQGALKSWQHEDERARCADLSR
jgi:hypothetical protein